MRPIEHLRKIRTAEELMRDNMLVKHYAGSISYGTNIPTSDVDFRGVFCADPINIRTPFFTVREYTDLNEEDTKLYELTHFIKLCLNCNPNIIETLWVDRSDIVSTSPGYELLRASRHDLLSSKLAFTFSGYAIAQLKRIRGHNKWINNPQPVEAPVEADYVTMMQSFLTEKIMPRDFDIRERSHNHSLVPYGGQLYGVYPDKGKELINIEGRLCPTDHKDHSEMGAPSFILKFNHEVYKVAKENHDSYWSWKNNRNKSRGELEEQFGYDTKHGMHLVRLLRMGVEALRDGEIIVKRPDAEELLSIRNGSWTYEEIVEYAEEMDHEVRDVLYHNTPLRKNPDIKLAAQLLMDVQDLIWER